MNQKTPIFNAPIAVKWIAGITLIAHLLRIYMLTTEDSLSTLIDMAFIPSRYKEVEVISITQLTSPLTYVFVHGDFTHLLINVFLFLAFGTAVGRRMGPQPLVVLYISSGLAGAFTFWLLNIGLVVPMIGASGAVSGMVGAVCRLSFRQSDPERPMPFHARKSAISFVVFYLWYVATRVFWYVRHSYSLGGPSRRISVRVLCHLLV